MPTAFIEVIEFLRFSTYKTSITLLYDGLGLPNPSAKIGKRYETEGENGVFFVCRAGSTHPKTWLAQ